MTIAPLLLALIATPAADETREPILLDFNASWCGPCQQMRPALAQLVQSGYPVKSIDIDRSPALAERYQVTSVPTFIVVDASGRSLARTQGLQPAAQLAGFYRTARAKLAATARPALPPAAQDEDEDVPDAKPDNEANDEPDAKAGPVNPKPWETVVRIKVIGNGAIGFGSGTIIHSTPEESIILTCAHIFKLEGQRQAPPSQFSRPIKIDLFDGQLRGTRPAQVHCIATVEGKAIDYDFDRDVGLIRIRPGRRLPASRVVPPTWVPRPGMGMTTVGCSEGQDATAWSTSIIKSGIRLFNNSSYEAIECVFAPKQGRSGGGLYTSDGYVAGVCDFAEPRGNHGFYATPRSIQGLLDRNRLTALYHPAVRGGKTLLASGRPAPRRSSAPSIARAQSPDRDESNEVTIPPPELLGIKAPAVAQRATHADKGRHAWHAPASAGDAPEPPDPTERTDLSLPPSADNDRFDAVADGPSPAPPETRRTPPVRRPSGRWRAVRTAETPLAELDPR